MKKLTHTAIINSGIRGFLCAGLTTVVTASFSWSFVASTNNRDWMKSSTLDSPEMATIREDS